MLIPYRAYSAATLIALGADEIVMHPFGELGPIDPTVSNEFNPSSPDGRRLGISVEDVKAYINFIKSTVGITHEDELVETIKILADKVHPLALGNVERFLSQSRMMAKKILRTHMPEANATHTINEIVENLASKLFFHGHPINRREAKEDLNLKVLTDLPPELETAMWDLYLEYEQIFQNDSPHNPVAELNAVPTDEHHVIGKSGNGQDVKVPRIESELVHAMVESGRLSSRHASRHRYTMIATSPAEKMISDDLLGQGWTHSSAPEESDPSPPSPPPSEGAQEGGAGRKGRKGSPNRSGQGS